MLLKETALLEVRKGLVLDSGQSDEI